MSLPTFIKPGMNVTAQVAQATVKAGLAAIVVAFVSLSFLVVPATAETLQGSAATNHVVQTQSKTTGSVTAGSIDSKPDDQAGTDSTAGVMTVHDIQIYISCREGIVRWSASVWGWKNVQYSVHHMMSYPGGGDSSWQYDGVVSTGQYGVGSTNTYIGGSGISGTVTLRVKIGGHEETASVNC